VSAAAPRPDDATRERPSLTGWVDLFRQGLAAWERATATAAESVARDPRTLEVGARLLRAHLLWRQSFDAAVEAAWAPFVPSRPDGEAI
jgi:hypothetical protein